MSHLFWLDQEHLKRIRHLFPRQRRSPNVRPLHDLISCFQDTCHVFASHCWVKPFHILPVEP